MACLFILLWTGSKGAIVTRLQFSHNKGVWSGENNGLPKVARRRKEGELCTSHSPPSASPPGGSIQADGSSGKSHVRGWWRRRAAERCYHACTQSGEGHGRGAEPWGAQLCPCFPTGAGQKRSSCAVCWFVLKKKQTQEPWPLACGWASVGGKGKRCRKAWKESKSHDRFN